MSVNDDLADRSIRHATYVERVKAGTANKLIKLLSRAEDDLVDQIRKRGERIVERGFDTGPATTARLDALLDKIREINASAYSGFSQALREDLQELVKEEALFQTGLLREVLPGVVVAEVGVSKPDLRGLFKIVNARPFQGKLLSEWASKLETDALTRIRDQIRIGMVENETIDQVVRRVRGTRALNYRDGVIDINRRNAAAIVRTAVGHTATVARQETWRDNADIIKGRQIVATLDTRTCPVCMAEDGKVYPIEGGRRPLFHIGCRCTETAVTKSFREMGIALDDIPPGTRRDMDGSVPATTDYPEWLRKQSRERVEDALGPTRAKLFVEGKMDISRFTDIRGRELPISALRTLEPEAFRLADL